MTSSHLSQLTSAAVAAPSHPSALGHVSSAPPDHSWTVTASPPKYRRDQTAMDTSVPPLLNADSSGRHWQLSWLQELVFLPGIRLFVLLSPCLLWGLCIESSPPCSQRVQVVGGDEIQIWEQQFLETNREANDRKHGLWTSADIFQAEICPATCPGLGTHIAFRNTRSRQERREGSRPKPGRQTRTLTLLCSLPSSYCGLLSEKKHDQGGKKHRMRGGLLPPLPTSSDTWRALPIGCVLPFSHPQDRNDDSRCLKWRERRKTDNN